jgi:predicted neuraminidase
MHRPLLISILLLSALPPSRAEDTTPSSTFTPDATLPGAQSAILPTLFATSHASELILLRNGDVLCFWFSGSHEGDSNVAIVMSSLPKGSLTWQTPVLVDQEPGKSYQNPVPIEAPDGTLRLLHTSQSAGQGQADAQVLEVDSRDGGCTWSRHTVIFSQPGSFIRQPPVLGDRGQLILPMYYSTSSGIVNGADTNYSTVKIAAPHSSTWTECRVPHSEGLVQMSIVKLTPRRFVAFFRSRFADRIFRSTSTNGCDWSAPVATQLPNNNASIQAARLADGRLVIVFNNASGHHPGHILQTGKRSPLSIAISADAGLTWTAVRDLEAGDPNSPNAVTEADEYSYPSVLQLPNGNILVTYTYRRQAIKSVLVPETWIAEGATRGQYHPN